MSNNKSVKIQKDNKAPIVTGDNNQIILFPTIKFFFNIYVIVFLVLVIIVNITYPSLEIKDTIYTLLILSFILSKIFLFFRKRMR